MARQPSRRIQKETTKKERKNEGILPQKDSRLINSPKEEENDDVQIPA